MNLYSNWYPFWFLFNSSSYIMLASASSRDILMRVIAKNLSADATPVEKVCKYN
jgi:hypothetical protein